MFCPNCDTSFVYRADYAAHLDVCQPADVDLAVSDELLARLNAAVARLYAESDGDQQRRTGKPGLVPAA